VKLRILLGDDHSFILKGIKGLLEDHYEVVGAEENGKALVDAALRLKPDMVVLDVSMPILNGIDAAREIKKALPSIKLVFLSMHSNAIYLRKALEAGASGYVLKSGAAEELLTGIEEARKGKVYVTPNFGQDVIESARDWSENGARSPLELTDRQKQILQLLAEGRQNKEIAEIAHISVRTVEFHRSRLMTKLGARSIAELTRFAIQEGLIGGAVNP
jgi:DNA-binding NarL/FixJ family response regulator